MENITEIVTSVVIYGAAIIGAASLILQGIAAITKITPSTRDDEIVSRVQEAVLGLQRVLDRIAMNPPADKARDPGNGAK